MSNIVDPRVVSSPVLIASGAIKSTEGYVFSVIFTWTGRTAGDFVQIRNGNGGEPLINFVVGAAAGTQQLIFPAGKRFSNGIYFNENTAGFTCAVDYR